MHDRPILKRHAALVDRMATALGLDLEEAALRGDLTPPDISDAVLSCTACSNPEHCETWLKEHGDGAPATPGYCRNIDMFDRLKALKPR